jgi:hypothetical protein
MAMIVPMPYNANKLYVMLCYKKGKNKQNTFGTICTIFPDGFMHQKHERSISQRGTLCLTDFTVVIFHMSGQYGFD